MKRLRLSIPLFLVIPLLGSGCAVIAVADMAVTATATVVTTAVKTTGAVVNAVLPSSK